MTPIKSTELVSARVPGHVYDTIHQAAELTGSSINQVLVQAAMEKATEIIEKERTITLSIKSADAFFEAIENPPAPGPQTG